MLQLFPGSRKPGAIGFEIPDILAPRRQERQVGNVFLLASLSAEMLAS
jgi:hypothetical protein